VLVAGAGPAGLGLGRLLAWRGWQVTFLQSPADDRPQRPDWLLVPASMAHQLPPPSIIDSALAVDVVLPGDWRMTLPARLALVDRRALVGAWARRARSAGVAFRRCASVRAPLRAGGRTAGVMLQDGTEIPATLTVDATGSGALLGALAGSGLRARRFEMEDREAVLATTTAVRPDRVQSSWAGRAQLLLDVDRPGAMAWRVVPRRGDALYVAATAGPGAARARGVDVLRAVTGGFDGDVAVAWRACRRPLDVVSAAGVLSLGGAAAALDPLTGVDLPLLLGTADLVDRTMACAPRGDVHTEALFGVTSAFQRSIGASIAVRGLVRRFLHRLLPEHREAVLIGGALGPIAWHAAVGGGDLTLPLITASPRARALPGAVSARFIDLVRRAVRVRAHHARFPRRYDVFELDRWQSTIEALFADQEPRT